MYKHTFDEVRFINRWSMQYPPDDWTILGVAKWWFNLTSYSYRFCFFGLEMHVWIHRTWHPKAQAGN